MRKRTQGDERRPEDSRAAWFVVLEQSRQANDRERAARAIKELARLGVTVAYAPARSDSGAKQGS
jgi:hypothetical protein